MQKITKVILIILGIIVVLYFGGLIGLWFIVRNVSFAP